MAGLPNRAPLSDRALLRAEPTLPAGTVVDRNFGLLGDLYAAAAGVPIFLWGVMVIAIAAFVRG